jgi:hypothetical protein
MKGNANRLKQLPAVLANQCKLQNEPPSWIQLSTGQLVTISLTLVLLLGKIRSCGGSQRILFKHEICLLTDFLTSWNQKIYQNIELFYFF